MEPLLSPGERALLRADDADAAEQRVDDLAALTVLAVVLSIFSATAFLWSAVGRRSALLWVVVALLGAPPFFRVVRRCRERWRLHRHPIPPPSPTTSMWFQCANEPTPVDSRASGERPIHWPRGRLKFLRQP